MIDYLTILVFTSFELILIFIIIKIERVRCINMTGFITI